MIEALKEIGEYTLEKENKDPLDILNDRAKLSSRTKKILAIILEKTKGGYVYKGVNIEDYSYSKPILYRGGSSAGVDILPSSLITEPNKTFEIKIRKWFDEHKGEYDFKQIYETLKGNEGKIKKDINEKYDALAKEDKKNVLLTLKVIDAGKEKHLGEIDEFKEFFKKEIAKKYHELKKLGVSKGNGCCYLCGKNGEMHGFVLPAIGLSFATADKPGFTPNFLQGDMWKDIPICSDCAFYLESGMEFLKENLNFPKKDNFLGFYYYVIPHFVLGTIPDDFYGDMKYFKNENYEEGLITREDWLEKRLEKESDIARLIFMFYTKKGGGKYIDIVQYVEDVLPSWLKKIDESQTKVKGMPLFGENSIKKILGKDWTGDFVTGMMGKEEKRGLGRNNWYLRFLRDFFSSAGRSYNKEFGYMMTSVISNKVVDRDLVFAAFAREIRDSIKKQGTYNLKVLCIKSLMLYLFLDDLALIRNENAMGGGKMDEKRTNDLKKRIEALFEDCKVDNPEKRAAFSVGMLVDYLLSVQRSVRGAGFGEEPFWNSLHGLVLDENRIKMIFKDALAKLRQYRMAYPSFESAVGEYLANAGEKWHTSKDMLSYYFALGMTLRTTLRPENVAQQEEGE
jgi:CRISPR-associated protein Csh1